MSTWQMSEWNRVENNWRKNRTDWMKLAWWKCSLFIWSVYSSSLIEAGLCVSWLQSWSHKHTHTRPLWDNDRLHRVTEHTHTHMLECDSSSCLVNGMELLVCWPLTQLMPVIIRACPSMMAINGFYRVCAIYIRTHTYSTYPLVLFKEAQLWFLMMLSILKLSWDQVRTSTHLWCCA